ncbi:MAG TPA: hypothetical protein VF000_01165, partial [Agromyces sp.]
FGLPNAGQVAGLTNGFIENVVVAGAHDFNAWNQLFTIWARDYLWQPESFVIDEITDLKDGVAATSLNNGNKNALTVKLDQAFKLLEKGKNAEVLEVLGGFVAQIDEFTTAGKLTAEQSAQLHATAEKIISNVGYWL